jgi:hypothetical protein
MVASGLDSVEKLQAAFSGRNNERQAMMDFLKVIIRRWSGCCCLHLRRSDARLVVTTHLPVLRVSLPATQQEKGLTFHTVGPIFRQQETVGVRNSAHTRAIATFLHDEVCSLQKMWLEKSFQYVKCKTTLTHPVGSQMVATSQQPGLGAKPRLTFCVEGNISVGKTTFLRRIAAECEALQGVVDIVPEPVEKWQVCFSLPPSGCVLHQHLRLLN